MTTEKSFFDDLKNFGAEVLQSKTRIDAEKRAKENENWETVLKEVHARMKYAQKNGWDHFLVNVETLTDEQRKELVKKIMDTDKRLTAAVRHHTLRDSSEADFLEVKINFTEK